MPVLKNDKNFSKSNNNIVKIEESVIEKASLSEIKTIKDKQVIQRIKKVIIYKPQLIAPPIPPKNPMITRSKNQQGTVWLGVPLDHKGRQQTLYRHKSSGIPVFIRRQLAWPVRDN